ncbi:M48 family metallopeptidase [Prevotella sp. 10(H)]|uniref:tetratricopeptide repeat protein n=1 Tax=Prevotella sp. 10(H) TaxID=1158294 RepID=UPI0004A76506|nr:hypothetical protein [Prevotella sp. 10(H)]
MRKKRIQIVLFTVIALVLLSSCAVRRPDSNARIGVSLPVQPEQQTEKKNEDDLPSVVEMKDRYGNKTIYAQTELDKEGNRQVSVHLSEVTITAKLKSIPERFGKVDVDFMVHIPENLIHEDWQVNLTPHLIKKETESDFDDLILTGREFDKVRQEGYRRYEKYMSRIIPDSLYNDHFVKTGAFNRYISGYLKSELDRIYRDSMEYVGFSNYTRKLQVRYDLFNNKIDKNKTTLRKRLSYSKIRQRYEYFERDTTYLASVYHNWFRFISSTFPQFYMLRELSASTMIKKYRDDRFQGEYINDYQPFTAADSAFIIKRFLKNDKIEKNRLLKDNMDIAFRSMVRFPKNETAKLDSVIFNAGKVVYYYHQELNTDEDSNRMQLYVDGTIMTKDGREYLLPPSDTLSYTVSSMIHFIDHTPRYKRKIIERKATSSLRANITFKAGRSELDISLGLNQSETDKVHQMIVELTETGEFAMDSISIKAGCSPEGSYRSNLLLAKKRGESIRVYLFGELSEIYGIEKMLPVYPYGEDWDGLVRLIQETEGIDQKQSILENISSVGDPDNREQTIKQKYPESYRIIRNELYPKLRAVDFTFHMHRRGMLKDTIHTTEPDTYYAKGIELMMKRKYGEALQILNEYADFNTAICMMSLGYDKAAYHILENEPESADGEYLMAVLASRTGQEEEAVKRYLRSVELDATKRWRGTLDPEINKLIKAHGLNNEDYH